MVSLLPSSSTGKCAIVHEDFLKQRHPAGLKTALVVMQFFEMQKMYENVESEKL